MRAIITTIASCTLLCLLIACEREVQDSTPRARPVSTDNARGASLPPTFAPDMASKIVREDMAEQPLPERTCIDNPWKHSRQEAARGYIERERHLWEQREENRSWADHENERKAEVWQLMNRQSEDYPGSVLSRAFDLDNDGTKDWIYRWEIYRGKAEPLFIYLSQNGCTTYGGTIFATSDSGLHSPEDEPPGVTTTKEGEHGVMGLWTYSGETACASLETTYEWKPGEGYVIDRQLRCDGCDAKSMPEDCMEHE